MRHLPSSNNVAELNRILNRVWDAIDAVNPASPQSVSNHVNTTSALSASPVGQSVPSWVNRANVPFGVIPVYNGEPVLDSDGCVTVKVIQ